jgi:hypothetical protein
MQEGEPVNLKSIAWLTVAVLQIGMAGNALAVTVFTDRTAFEAVLASYSVEDFESYAPFGDPDALPLFPDGLTDWSGTDFSLSATPQAIKILGFDYPASSPEVVNTTSGGANYLYLDTDKGLVGSETVFSLYQPADAFGFNYTGVFEPGTTFTVQIGSDTFNLNLNNPEATPLFWGVLGLGSFTDITLTTSIDSGYGVDDVIFGSAVPLPPAIWLFGSGLLALAGGAWKRKVRS